MHHGTAAADRNKSTVASHRHGIAGIQAELLTVIYLGILTKALRQGFRVGQAWK